MHSFWYERYLQYQEVQGDVSVVSITSDDDQPVVHETNFLRIGHQWRAKRLIVQKSWKWRAVKLNRRRPVGVITRLPPPVRMAPSTDVLVCNDIANNWCVFRVKLEKYLFSKRREKHVYKRFICSIEQIRKGHHLYLEMYMCTSLVICLFGVAYC